MADTGGDANVSGVNLTFDDEAVNSLPNGGPLVTGSFKPTIGTAIQNLTGCQEPTSFPSPAPAATAMNPYGTVLSVFDGANPNGTWSLFVIDDTTGDTGSFSGGWTLDITTQAVAVTVAGISARTTKAGVLVRWRTGTEADTLGFHLYRERAGKRVRVDRRLIPAKGSVSGARYSFLDRRAPHGKLRYRLQAIGKDGSREWFGPVGVAR
jgi:hypothetical protein